MKYLSKFFIICITACIASGCSSPVGSIDNSGSGNGGNIELDTLWLRPNRFLYETSNRFDSEEDLRIYATVDGTFKEISPDEPDITIEMVTNPGLSSEVVTTVAHRYFPFSLAGRYVVRVKYKDKSDHYSVEVRGAYDDSDRTGEFIDIIWL